MLYVLYFTTHTHTKMDNRALKNPCLVDTQQQMEEDTGNPQSDFPQEVGPATKLAFHACLLNQRGGAWEMETSGKFLLFWPSKDSQESAASINYLPFIPQIFIIHW